MQISIVLLTNNNNHLYLKGWTVNQEEGIGSIKEIKMTI